MVAKDEVECILKCKLLITDVEKKTKKLITNITKKN